MDSSAFTTCAAGARRTSPPRHVRRTRSRATSRWPRAWSFAFTDRHPARGYRPRSHESGALDRDFEIERRLPRPGFARPRASSAGAPPCRSSRTVTGTSLQARPPRTPIVIFNTSGWCATAEPAVFTSRLSGVTQGALGDTHRGHGHPSAPSDRERAAASPAPTGARADRRSPPPPPAAARPLGRRRQRGSTTRSLSPRLRLPAAVSLVPGRELAVGEAVELHPRRAPLLRSARAAPRLPPAAPHARPAAATAAMIDEHDDAGTEALPRFVTCIGRARRRAPTPRDARAQSPHQRRPILARLDERPDSQASTTASASPIAGLPIPSAIDQLSTLCSVRPLG